MKKTQRSYSSFRAKTQQAQIVQDEEPWVTSQNGQKILNNLNHKISNSQLNNPNNKDLFQSISERVIPNDNRDTHYSSYDPCIVNNSECNVSERSSRYTNSNLNDNQRNEKVIAHLRQKCKNYQKALQFYYKQRQQTSRVRNMSKMMTFNKDQSFSINGQSVDNYNMNKQNNPNKQNIKHGQNFNYSQRYYQTQMQQLQGLLQKKQLQIQNLKKQSSAQSCQIMEMSSSISSRIQKQKTEKNLFIKELNLKNIQIKGLHQKFHLFQGSIRTKQIIIKDMTEQILTLKAQLNSQDKAYQKNKIQTYELRIKDTQDRLKIIEQQAIKLNIQNERKNQQNKQKSQQVQLLMTNLEQYQAKLKLIQVSLIQQLNTNKKMSQKYDQQTKQYENTKKQYFKLIPLKEQMKQKQIQMKNMSSVLTDIKTRNGELVMQIENLSENTKNCNKMLLQISQYEISFVQMSKQLKLKNQQLNEVSQLSNHYQALIEQHKNLQNSYNSNLCQLKKSKNEHQQDLKKMKQLELSMELYRNQATKKQHSLSCLQQRIESFSTISKQNQKLESLLHQKLSEIQKFQLKISSLQNKICNLLNENTKINVINKGLEEDLKINLTIFQQGEAKINQLEHKLDQFDKLNEDLEQRIKREEQLKQHLEEQLYYCQEQLNKIHNQCTAYKTTILKLEQENVQLANQIEGSRQQHMIQMEQVHSTIIEYQQANSQCQKLLQQQTQKINRMNNQIQQLKTTINNTIEQQKTHKTQIEALQRLLFEKQAQLTSTLQQKHKLKQSIKQMFTIGQHALA